MTEIADTIHRERSTVTTLVSKLIKLGYISNKKDSNDSRSSIIYLTEKGHGLKTGFEEILQNLYEREYEGISSEENLLHLKDG